MGRIEDLATRYRSQLIGILIRFCRRPHANYQTHPPVVATF